MASVFVLPPPPRTTAAVFCNFDDEEENGDVSIITAELRFLFITILPVPLCGFSSFCETTGVGIADGVIDDGSMFDFEMNGLI